MNQERLIILKEAILKYSDQFNYQQWIDEGSTGAPVLAHLIPKEHLDLDCGTCGCVAGFTCMIYTRQVLPNHPFYNYVHTYDDISSNAKRILGLDDKQAEFLFSPWRVSELPDDIMRGTGTFAVKEAINRIEWLLSEQPLEDYNAAHGYEEPSAEWNPA